MGSLIHAEEGKKKIRSSIGQILPDLETQKADKVASYLFELGFCTKQDLVYVKMEDIEEKLCRAHCRKLLANWQKPEDQNPSISKQGQQSSYRIKWTKIPDHMLQQIHHGNALTNAQMDKVVGLIVEDVKATVPNVGRSFFKGVAADMASKYPNAFKDMVVSGRKGATLTTEGKLIYKMQNKFDNENRKNRSKRHLTEVEAPARPEAYGCVKWQVMQMPEGETEQSLKVKQQDMKATFQKSKQEWNWKELKPLIEATFCLQRRDINGQVQKPKRKKRADEDADLIPLSTQDILSEWPSLFTYEGMLHHFKILTGKCFKTSLRDWMGVVKLDFIDFLAKKSEINEKIRSRMHRAVKEETCTDPELTAVICMLVEYFKEEVDQILEVHDGGRTIAAIETEVEIPATPLIIADGKSAFRSRKYFVTLDGKVQGTARSFQKALGLLFCSYYVFNLRYPEGISLTLEFIQRSIVDVNPDMGTKSSEKKKRKNQRGYKLSVLASEFKAYQEKNISEEDDQ